METFLFLLLALVLSTLIAIRRNKRNKLDSFILEDDDYDSQRTIRSQEKRGKKRHNEKRSIKQHNSKKLKEKDQSLLLEILSQQFMEDCYLTSISCPSKRYSCQCPSCGKKLEELVWIEYCSPDWTWEELCGRKGYFVFCPSCRKLVDQILTAMN